MGLKPTAVTVIVPTCNMASFLEPLIDSIYTSKTHGQLDRILIVNDGSTDGTSETVARLQSDPRFGTKIREWKLPSNRGRFWARYLGAQEATSEWLLFLDSRITLLSDFGEALSHALARGLAAIGRIEIDTQKNIYSLYWQRSHESIFSQHYSADTAVELTPENYDLYLKGTGTLLCRRDAFLAACRKFEHSDLKSDDTLLMKEMVRSEPLVIDPRLRIGWEPRGSLGPFLWRLIDRGPGFVEYHVVGRQGAFFWIVVLGLVLLAGWVSLLAVSAASALYVFCAALALLCLSTFAFTKSLKEWARLWPLHIMVVFSFGVGVLWGLAFIAARSAKALIMGLARQS